MCRPTSSRRRPGPTSPRSTRSCGCAIGADGRGTRRRTMTGHRCCAGRTAGATPNTRAPTSITGTRFPTAPRAWPRWPSSFPCEVQRVLDLGTGDGVTLGLVRDLRPGAHGLACDFSDEMLARAGGALRRRTVVEITRHDLDEPLPGELGGLRPGGEQLRDPPRRRRPQAGAVRRDLRAARARAGRSSTSSTSPRRRRSSTTSSSLRSGSPRRTTIRRTYWRRSPTNWSGSVSIGFVQGGLPLEMA